MLANVVCVDILDDIGPTRLFQQRDLPDGSAGNTLVVSIKPNFFQSHNASRTFLFRLINNSVRP